MFFNLLAYALITMILKYHHSLLESLLYAAILYALTFIAYAIFNVILAIVFTPIAASFMLDKVDADNVEEVESDIEKRKLIGEYRFPLVAITLILLFKALTHLIKVPVETEFVVLLLFAIHTLIAYIDRVFTHMAHKFLPVIIEVLLYVSAINMKI